MGEGTDYLKWSLHLNLASSPGSQPPPLSSTVYSPLGAQSVLAGVSQPC